MYEHLIIIGSDYETGKRIGFHTSYPTKQENASVTAKFRRSLKPILDEAKKSDISLAVHQIQTDDSSWESVVQYDPFFENIILEDRTYNLLWKLSSKKRVKARDISHLILSKVQCTPLKLQKLLYLCYADYLVKTGEKMFDEKIIAYEFGPVIQEVYKEHRGKRSKLVIDDDIQVNFSSDLEFYELVSMITARVTMSIKGFEIYESCMETLSNYSELTARELVDLTHEEGGPWSCVYDSKKFNKVIPDEIIMACHKLNLL